MILIFFAYYVAAAITPLMPDTPLMPLLSFADIIAFLSSLLPLSFFADYAAAMPLSLMLAATR